MSMLTQTAKPQVEAKTVARVKSPLALQIKHAYRRTDVWSADSNQLSIRVAITSVRRPRRWCTWALVANLWI